MRLRVYADRDHYSEDHRSDLNDILKAFWNNASAEERRSRYGNRTEVFELVDEPTAADVHLLPMRWQHYVNLHRVDQVRRAIDAARRARKPIAVFSLGDFEANFPIVGQDIHLFQVSAYRSRRQTSTHAMPAFIEDPLATFGDRKVTLLGKRERPVVGFCGQAGSSVPRHAFRYMRNRYHHLMWRVGREAWEPPPLEHTWYRQQVLDTFQRSTLVDARFVLRTRYRAGLSQAKDRNDPAQQARREFLENVTEADYTVCVRGGGNFSIRIYEALAMGRSPVFIDTDCLLPFHDKIRWSDHLVWVDQRELSRAPELVASAYARLSERELHERQLAARALWLDRLTPDGFYAHFHEHFPGLE